MLWHAGWTSLMSQTQSPLMWQTLPCTCRRWGPVALMYPQTAHQVLNDLASLQPWHACKTASQLLVHRSHDSSRMTVLSLKLLCVCAQPHSQATEGLQDFECLGSLHDFNRMTGNLTSSLFDDFDVSLLAGNRDKRAGGGPEAPHPTNC